MALFPLPDVGEGLTEAEIVSWKVQPGDTVAVNDVLVEIETAKSLVELPSPFAGTVEALLADEGQTVTVGTAIISVDTGGSQDVDEPDEPKGEPVLVGYGPRPSRRRRRPPRPAAEGSAALHGAFSTGHEVGLPVAPPPPPHSVSPVGAGDDMPTHVLPSVGAFPDEDEPEPEPDSEPADARSSPLAKPPVRRLARDLGVDLAAVVASAPTGIISRADVEAHARSAAASGADADEATGWDGRKRIERVPVRSVRKATARAVVASAFSAPHVTQFLTVDVTASMHLLDRLRADARFAGPRLSPLTVAARAMALAVRRTPQVNSLWDGETGEIVLRRYVDLGVATATPRGLLVPVVRDADRLDLASLAAAIADLAERAREGRTTPSETSGGTVSITNIGVFGMDAGTPIMPPGHSAILALGQVARRPWVVERDGVEEVVPRWVTTLSLSFDHRLLDGAQASAFLGDVAGSLEDPALAWATW